MAPKKEHPLRITVYGPDTKLRVAVMAKLSTAFPGYEILHEETANYGLDIHQVAPAYRSSDENVAVMDDRVVRALKVLAPLFPPGSLIASSKQYTYNNSVLHVGIVGDPVRVGHAVANRQAAATALQRLLPKAAVLRLMSGLTRDKDVITEYKDLLTDGVRHVIETTARNRYTFEHEVTRLEHAVNEQIEREAVPPHLTGNISDPELYTHVKAAAEAKGGLVFDVELGTSAGKGIRYPYGISHAAAMAVVKSLFPKGGDALLKAVLVGEPYYMDRPWKIKISSWSIRGGKLVDTGREQAEARLELAMQAFRAIAPDQAKALLVRRQNTDPANFDLASAASNVLRDLKYEGVLTRDEWAHISAEPLVLPPVVVLRNRQAFRAALLSTTRPRKHNSHGLTPWDIEEILSQKEGLREVLQDHLNSGSISPPEAEAIALFLQDHTKPYVQPEPYRWPLVLKPSPDVEVPREAESGSEFDVLAREARRARAAREASGSKYVATMLSTKEDEDGNYRLYNIYLDDGGHFCDGHLELVGDLDRGWQGKSYTRNSSKERYQDEVYVRIDTPDGVRERGVGAGSVLYYGMTLVAQKEGQRHGLHIGGVYSQEGDRDDSAEEWWGKALENGGAEEVQTDGEERTTTQEHCEEIGDHAVENVDGDGHDGNIQEDEVCADVTVEYTIDGKTIQVIQISDVLQMGFVFAHVDEATVKYRPPVGAWVARAKMGDDPKAIIAVAKRILAQAGGEQPRDQYPYVSKTSSTQEDALAAARGFLSRADILPYIQDDSFARAVLGTQLFLPTMEHPGAGELLPLGRLGRLGAAPMTLRRYPLPPLPKETVQFLKKFRGGGDGF